MARGRDFVALICNDSYPHPATEKRRKGFFNMTARSKIDMLNFAAMNPAQLDLNLLVSLNALLQERNVTRAGRRIGLSQPAMSAALATTPTIRTALTRARNRPGVTG